MSHDHIRKMSRTEMVACEETRRALKAYREAVVLEATIRRLNEEWRAKREECRASLQVARELRYGGESWHKAFLQPVIVGTPCTDILLGMGVGKEDLAGATDEELKDLERLLEGGR